MFKLSEEEIRQRFRELYNFKNILYPQLKDRSSKLREENMELKERNKELEKENKEVLKQVEKLLLELEELKIMKFGKKREKSSNLAKPLPADSNSLENKEGQESQENQENQNEEKVIRTNESYRRQEPKKEEITDYLRMEINECPDCWIRLKDIKENIHYREDLYEVENLIKSAKKIVETIVESWTCPNCKNKQYAMEIPKQKVIIGQNIRNMIVYMIIVQGLSYTETQKSLKSQYGIDISNWEIINILEWESYLVSEYYNHIVEELNKENMSHYDETTWKTKDFWSWKISEWNYAWVKVSLNTENKLIWFWRSRGKWVAESMRWNKKWSIWITDDYPWYNNCFDHHQLCWAHPHRKLRDLANSDNLSKDKSKICKKAYKDFSNVYEKARKLRNDFKKENFTILEKSKLEKSKILKKSEKIKKQFEKLFKINPKDPEKLKSIRKRLQEKENLYFTFLEFPEIKLPLDNNKAERAIRKIVIKRKKSFWCRSPKWANVLSILYSVVFSLIDSNPDQNFFSLYKQAIEFEKE